MKPDADQTATNGKDKPNNQLGVEEVLKQVPQPGVQPAQSRKSTEVQLPARSPKSEPLVKNEEQPKMLPSQELRLLH